LFVLSAGGMECPIRETGGLARAPTIPPQPEEPPGEAEMERMATTAAPVGAPSLPPSFTRVSASEIYCAVSFSRA
jgi:hypothetical protein